MKNETDPELLKELQKKQLKITEGKLKRREKFKNKVIEMVGGEKYFNSNLFEELLQKGNASLESIVKAVKIDPSEVGSMEPNVDEIQSKGSTNKVKDNSNEEASTDSEVIPEEEQDKTDGVIEEKQKTEAENVIKNEPVIQEKDSEDDKSTTSSSDSEDEDDNLTLPTGRTRGRGRRGKKDADAEREKQNEKTSLPQFHT